MLCDKTCTIIKVAQMYTRINIIAKPEAIAEVKFKTC